MNVAVQASPGELHKKKFAADSAFCSLLYSHAARTSSTSRKIGRTGKTILFPDGQKLLFFLRRHLQKRIDDRGRFGIIGRT